ncbi:MAG: three-Cys-motif partner protein TcmP, partial [Chloroflexi bacterium]|nr:three-Cys-motif partner protein TcmP [Chloroflexota bacterium]
MNYEMPDSTLPEIAPHTLAKHQILTHHLGAWFPILGRYSGRLLYVDGFAGPGEYAGGEDGSPILALQTVRDHVYSNEFIDAGKRFQFLFVEKNSIFVKHLRQRIASQVWPRTFDIDVRHGEFEEIFSGYLNDIGSGMNSMPPALIFIDPFGSAGFPMAIFSRLASYMQTDILINFNWVDLNHWILPDKSKHITLDQLYGSGR